MEEKDLEQVEETQQVEESKFMSADDDDVIKVDLSKPVENEKPEEEQPEEATDSPADDAGLV